MVHPSLSLPVASASPYSQVHLSPTSSGNRSPRSGSPSPRSGTSSSGGSTGRSASPNPREGRSRNPMASTPMGSTLHTTSSSGDTVIFSSQDDYAWERARQLAQFLHLDAVQQGECAQQEKWRRTLSKDKAKEKKDVGHVVGHGISVGASPPLSPTAKK